MPLLILQIYIRYASEYVNNGTRIEAAHMHVRVVKVKYICTFIGLLIDSYSLSLSDIVMEEAPTTPIPAPPVLHTLPPPPPPPPPAIAAAPSLPPPPTPPSPAVTTERDGVRRGGAAAAAGGGRLGLTKEVLSAHTQQEEQNFLCRFRDLSQLRVFDPASVLRRHTTTPITRGMIICAHIHTCIHKQKQTSGNCTHLYFF